MEANTVILRLDEYERLKDKDMEFVNILIKHSIWIQGGLFADEKIISTNEAVKQLAQKLSDALSENKELKKQLAEKESEKKPIKVKKWSWL